MKLKRIEIYSQESNQIKSPKPIKIPILTPQSSGDYLPTEGSTIHRREKLP